MVPCKFPIYTYIWFWLIAVGLLFLAIGFIVWDVRSNLSQTWWVYALIIGGAILLLIGLGIALWSWWKSERSMNAPEIEMDIPMNSVMRREVSYEEDY